MKEQQHVKTFEGAPPPSDVFQPHKLGVELLSDMDALFEGARRLSATGEYPAGGGEVPAEEVPAEVAAQIEEMKGQHSVVIVTPGRLLMPVPVADPGSVPRKMVEEVSRMLPPDPPRVVTVISYTYVPALIENQAKAIPFLGFLGGFAMIGHTVVVFEGHPSAFESGVRGSDVLMVDSGMLPFMQGDWLEVAFRVMRPGAQVLVHDRATYKLAQLFPPGTGPAPSGPGAVAFYADALLRLLISNKTRTSVQVASGEALPNLADFTESPEDLAYLASLPFKQDALDADEVIDYLLHAAGWRPYSVFKKRGEVRVQIVPGVRPWTCSVTLSKSADGTRRLLIER
jgi:hypothetical protein